jgi:hypothetical protein
MIPKMWRLSDENDRRPVGAVERLVRPANRTSSYDLLESSVSIAIDSGVRHEHVGSVILPMNP